MHRTICLALALGLAACSGPLVRNSGPDHVEAPPPAPERWQAPLPHGGDPEQLARWWEQFNDPVLVRLIEAAQAASPGLAQAAATIANARAELVNAGAAAGPTADLLASVNRAALTFGGPPITRTLSQIGPQASWEIDLFGRLARTREAARARLEASVSRWHEARGSLAADVADAYLGWRHCVVQGVLAQADAESRARSAQLAEAAQRAGLQSPASVQLARAQADDGRAAALRQQSQCDLAVRGTVALTAIDENQLQSWLDAIRARGDALPAAPALGLAALPVQVLRQRPDLAAAERDVAAASAEIGVAEAQRYPVLSLSGNILPARVALTGSPALSVTTWSIGPALSLPLYDGGRHAASTEAARAAWRAAEVTYRARARQAVREVEEALLRLDSAAQRLEATRASLGNVERTLQATEARQRAGLAGLPEVEDARRQALAARVALRSLEHERNSAWIALYRAAGGGWQPERTPAS